MGLPHCKHLSDRLLCVLLPALVTFGVSLSLVCICDLLRQYWDRLIRHAATVAAYNQLVRRGEGNIAERQHRPPRQCSLYHCLWPCPLE